MKTITACVVALCFAGGVAQASSSIVGDWSGSGTAVTVGPGGNGADELAEVVFSSATPSSGGFALLGTLDVTCIGFTAAQCGTGGIVDISGALSAGGALDFGVAGNPSLFAGNYPGGTTFTGVASSLDGDVYDWTFNSSSAVAAPEIDPAGMLGGLTLLTGALAVIRGRRRQATERLVAPDHLWRDR
jgi:hypothetical protein